MQQERRLDCLFLKHPEKAQILQMEMKITERQFPREIFTFVAVEIKFGAVVVWIEFGVLTQFVQILSITNESAIPSTTVQQYFHHTS